MSGKITPLCCIFNYAPHYRLPIFRKLDSECSAHFYFGNRLTTGESIEKLDYSALKGFVRELQVRSLKLGPTTIECTSGWMRLALNSQYRQYLITPNPFALNQWLFLLLCRMMGKRVYAWTHGLRTAQIPRRTLRLWRLYDRLLQGSFLYGDFARRNMIGLGFAPQKLHLIYNSLNYSLSKSLRLSALQNPYAERWSGENPTLIFIGRLTAVKRLDMLVEAVRLLEKRGVTPNVVMVGDGPLRQHLQQSLRDREALRYWFVGALYDESEIARYLYWADLCVSPGNVGLTAIHALSYGLPVITNDNFETQMPEFEAIEQGRTGDFFCEGDVGSLADRIELWLSRNPNREQVRQRCYEVIDTKYNPSHQVEVLSQVLDL